ncbi:MAG: DUF1684 domain-containing protein [Thermomicrobiales bacterium]
MSALTDFRADKDRFFADDPQSPLTPDQRRDFAGLAYYMENPELRFNVRPDLLDDPTPVQLALSTGEAVEYIRWGHVSFEVEGKQVSLTVFRAAEDDYLFLPFKDTTSDADTYGAGRYLEPEIDPSGSLILDFNYAYNPYCAYNENWSCPLTPAENVFDVAIAAGEKRFPGGH